MSGGPIVYVSDGYPKLAETFTMREVRALHAAGLVARVVSLHARGERDPAPDATLDPPVDVLPHPLSAPALSAFLRALVTRPLESLRLVALALLPHTRPLSWRWQVRAPLHVLWGAWLARQAPPGAHFHAQFLGAASTVAWAAARLSRGTFSVTAHQDWAMPLARAKLRDALVVLSISERMRRELMALAPAHAQDRVVLSRLGVEVPPEEACPKAKGLAIKVVAVGTIGPTKGHDTLIRAVHLAARRADERLEAGGPRLDIELEIIGGGPALEELERFEMNTRGRATVHLRGSWPHEKTLRRLRENADIVALACRTTPTGDVDGIPIALMEGMAAGKATVSTRVGAIPELIEDGVSGRLCAPDSPDELAGVLLELATDRALRERLGAAGRARILGEFEAGDAARRLVAIFRERLGARARESETSCR